MTLSPHLLQVCNVGTVVGGTGACAWTVTRALPDWKHTVLFFSPVRQETRKAFDEISVETISRLKRSELEKYAPDLVLYHNTARHRIEEECLTWRAIYYQHSRVAAWSEISTVACSSWLSSQVPAKDRPEVLQQAVPRAVRPICTSRRARLGEEIVVGRICTPSDRKWPRELIPCYRQLAQEHPQIVWEFVGCPKSLQAELQPAVNHRVNFHEAGWDARSHYWNWDVLLYHHPTLTESFGRTVAEAMRTGCIPVVDRRGGFCEQIEANSGFLCENLEEFSAVLQVLRDPSERIARSRRCRAIGDEKFSLRGFRKRLLNQFQRLL
ncbi:MAG: glycosyltransferase family 4 protein [Planctomycetaceae bacterium]|nr:glycosyltransferase family 4 protein [Planctomycetaceae bacterium]